MADIVTNFDLSGKNVLIQAQNNPFYGKKIGFIGDSFTKGATLANPNVERFSYLVCKQLGAIEVNVGVSGTGFVAQSNFPKSFSKQAEDLKSKSPDCDVIVVLGGINDINRKLEQTVVIEAQNDTFDKLRQLFPDALICWAGFNYPSTASDWLANMRVSGRVNAYPYYSPNYNGVKTLCNPTDRIKYNEANYSSDFTHPNAQGHAQMATVIVSSLLGGTDNKFTTQVQSSFEDGVSGILTAVCIDNVYHVIGQLTITKDFSLGWNKIATMSVPLGNLLNARGSASVVVSSQFYACAVEVRPNGDVYIQDVDRRSTGNRFYTFQLTAIPFYDR